jgi:hypothetical protein
VSRATPKSVQSVFPVTSERTVQSAKCGSGRLVNNPRQTVSIDGSNRWTVFKDKRFGPQALVTEVIQATSAQRSLKRA